MASTYTPLGIELMATGENAGTWGTKTNTNLQLFEQIAGGYASVTVNGTGDTALSISDGATGANGASRVIILTGTITGNITVSIPLDVENFYFIKNATTGSFTVEFKYTSGSGTSVTWATDNKGWKALSAKGDDATNPNVEEISLSVATDPAGTTGQVQVNSAGSFGAVSEGSAGQLLTSNGAGAAPTFQNAPASGISTGKAIAMAIVFG